jgi:hypothetical protein
MDAASRRRCEQVSAAIAIVGARVARAVHSSPSRRTNHALRPLPPLCTHATFTLCTYTRIVHSSAPRSDPFLSRAHHEHTNVWLVKIRRVPEGQPRRAGPNVWRRDECVGPRARCTLRTRARPFHGSPLRRSSSVTRPTPHTTSSLAAVSLVALCIMAVLFVSELVYWRTMRVEDHIIVDKSIADRDFEIALDLTFHARELARANTHTHTRTQRPPRARSHLMPPPPPPLPPSPFSPQCRAVRRR